MIHALTPKTIRRFSVQVRQGLWVLWAALTLWGLYLGLVWSPADYQQGETVRIMYVHVPASWGALACYTIMAVLSAIGLIKRLPMMSVMCRAAAPIGFMFCGISLITGAIWGYPTWGTWWVWDARLTSMALLGFLYAAFLYFSADPFDQKSAYIAIIGWVNIPIIKGSVEWWNTLHQPAGILRFSKPAVHWTMLYPLSVMTLSFICLSILIFLARLDTILERLNQERNRL